MLILFNVQFTIVTDGDAVLYNVHTVQCILLVPIVQRWAGRANFLLQKLCVAADIRQIFAGDFCRWLGTMTLSEK